MEHVIDLSTASTWRELDELLSAQTRHDFVGSRVRLIVGHTALADTSLPRRIAGYVLGADHITVNGTADAPAAWLSVFVTELTTATRTVLADHLRMLRGL